MLQIRTILHPTDFSPGAEAAFAHALRLARRHGAAVHLVHVVPDLRGHHLRDAIKALMDEEAFYRRQRDEAEQKMQALLDAHHVAAVPVERKILGGLMPAAALLAYAEGQDVDLIVTGTHGTRGLRHVLMGSVAESLVRKASCPVLAVRVPDDAREVALPVCRRVLVPVDFSGFAGQAVCYARALAAAAGAALDLLHVVDPVRNPAFYEAGLRGREALAEDLEAEALRQLEALWRETAGPEAAPAFHARTGYPPAEIVAFAEAHRADLIVLPTHGLRGLERIPMGSVAERVVRAAPCPVFVVKPFGKSLLRTVPAAGHAAVPSASP